MLLEDLKSVKTHTVEEIAKKHNVDVAQINAQLKKGIKVEHEHTTSNKEAREIALDHLWEMPNYYDKLSTIEEKSCWKGYKKKGTKMKGGKRVNNCVKEDDNETV